MVMFFAPSREGKIFIANTPHTWKHKYEKECFLGCGGVCIDKRCFQVFMHLKEISCIKIVSPSSGDGCFSGLTNIHLLKRTKDIEKISFVRFGLKTSMFSV